MENKILVVDDEKEIAELVELYLKNDGFQVEKHTVRRKRWRASHARPPLWRCWM